MSGPRAVLLVLAKAPVPDQVKTRLCPPFTAAEASRVAAAALVDTLDAVRAVPRTVTVTALSGRLDLAEDAEAVRAALTGVSITGQRGSTLGERIAAAHADTAALFPGLPILQIGMDTPQISPPLLEHCLDLLDHRDTDAVLGPARDGGWWALGVRDPAVAGHLTGVPTSRPDTGARTVAALRAAGCRVATLPELTDVDTTDDAVAVAARIPASRFAVTVADLLTPVSGEPR